MKALHLFRIFTGICLLFFTLQSNAAIWYVSTTGSDDNAGDSWAQAFRNIQTAIDTAAAGDEVWVAAGIYAPTEANNPYFSHLPRWRSFNLQKKDVRLYGGFAGYETDTGQRDWGNNATILSGASTNSYHVVYTTQVSIDCIVDGFTITGGNANDGSGPTTSFIRTGGGWYNDAQYHYSNPTIVNCTFTDNYANATGGAFINNSEGGISFVSFTGCSFIDNMAPVASGGAVYSESSGGAAELTFTDCYFKGNRSKYGGAFNDNATEGFSQIRFTGCTFDMNIATNDGGAIYTYNNEGDTRISIERCSFQGNQSGSFGGAMNLWTDFGNVSTKITNCVMTGNTALGAGAIYHQQSNGTASIELKNSTLAGNTGSHVLLNLGSACVITNCIVRDNNSDSMLNPGNVTYSDVMSGINGTGNISVDPEFLDLGAGDVRLGICSPAVDAGTNANAPATDRDGAQRPQGASTDMGAYERSGLEVACAGVTVYLDEDGTISLPASELDNNSAGCGNLSFTVNGSSTLNIGCSMLGLNTLPLHVTDQAGHSGDCNGTVAVFDTLAPAITCPSDQVITMTGSSCSGVVGNWAPVSVDDNCSASPTVVQVTPPSTPLNGHNAAHTVTLKATDIYLNAATCTFTVTLKDQTPPKVVCKNATLYLDATGSASLSPDQVLHSGTDNCGAIAALQLSPFFFTCLHVGTNTVKVTALDNNGNAAICFPAVTVIDNIAPSVTCKSKTVYLSETGTVTVGPDDVLLNGSDNCTVTYSVSPASFDCSQTGARVATLTADDGHGNLTSCTATLTVADAIPPTVTCQNKTVYLDAAGSVTFSSADLVAGASDNCGSWSQQATSHVFNCSHLGANTVSAAVSDNHGNTASCTATVTVLDNLAPAVVCKNATVYLDASGNAVLTTGAVFQSGSDNCGTVNQVSVVPNAFTCANLSGTNTVTLTVNDGHENQATCTATVTVRDILAPAMVCKNVTVNLDASGNASITTAQINNGSSDNCGIGGLTLNQTAFGCVHLGNNPVTLTGTDASGNTAACTAVVTVKDVTLPVAKCKNITVNLGSNGSLTVAPAQVNNGSSDNCSFTLSLLPATFSCANTGLNLVTLRATDGGGNTATCTAGVTVKDVSAPAALCKNATVYLNQSGQGTLTVPQSDNGSNDACGIASLTLSKTQFNCSEILGSPWPVTLTVKDVNNNTSTCLSYISVKDNLAPTAVCENVTVTLNAQGKATVSGAALAEESYDNCSVGSYTPISKLYTTASIGVNNLQITVKDWSGNAATCVSQVTVLPYSGLGGYADERTDEPAEEPEVSIYPNPAFGDVTVEFSLPEARDYHIAVYDPAGKVIRTQEGGGQESLNRITLSLSNVPAGLYLVELRSASLKAHKRLMVSGE